MNALKWITAEAKRIKKRYPRRFKKWTEYVSQASAIYARKHKGRSPVGHKRRKIGAVAKKTRTRKLKHRPFKMTREQKKHFGHGEKNVRLNNAVVEFSSKLRRLKNEHAAEGKTLKSLAGIPELRRKLKERYKDQLAAGMLSHYQAKTKRAKNKIAKRLTEIKRKLRMLER